ncbi:TIGR04149 family rSAM-modified RiPP [Phocaeicola barnesiae]|uniref:TIGR04149 family rSAM-modified RiPP n=1 Tax=Phocaeicola barnesiae TaxID=376804 RepID=UPI00242CBA1B|nr:TIGR04149 family rSAM-modified RiPP [Phocaeicola barnesiae]
MKKLKKLTLVDGMRSLSNSEMKHLKGGYNYVYCHCKGSSGEGKEAKSCDECHSVCQGAGVQNCNYVVG